MIVSMKDAITKGAIGLGIFAVVTAGLIAATQVGTSERIKAEIKKAQSKALIEIIPTDKHDNDLLEDSIQLPVIAELGLKKPSEAYVAYQQNKADAIILPVVAPDGYTGEISMIVGIDSTGTVRGVRVLTHKETPGLGDKVDRRKSDWIESFKGKSLANPNVDGWKVIKDGGEFDQFTGATITPRAVVSAVYRSLKYFDEHKDSLLRNKGNENPEAAQ